MFIAAMPLSGAFAAPTKTFNPHCADAMARFRAISALTIALASAMRWVFTAMPRLPMA